MITIGNNPITITPDQFDDTDIEFDQVVTFTPQPDGSMVAAPSNTHAPLVYHRDSWVAGDPLGSDIIISDRNHWEPYTGFTGQYGYNGPIMHASEQLTGTMLRTILEQAVADGETITVAVCAVEVLGHDESCVRDPSTTDLNAGDDPTLETNALGTCLYDHEPAGWCLLRLVEEDGAHA